MEDSRGLLFGDRKAAAQEAPVLFDFAHLAFLPYRELVNGIGERENEVKGGGKVVGVIVFDFKREKGVVEYAATNHNILNLGESLADSAIIGSGADVAVVNDFVMQKG